MRSLLLTLGVALALAAPLAAQIPAGDAAWARRAEGSRGASAASQPVETAIAAYRKAVTADADDLEARWKLLRALRFKGAYVASSAADKKAVYSEARKVGDESLARLQTLAAKGGIKSIEKDKAETVAAALRRIDGAGELLHWDAVAWGEWALVYGKMAAVRQGAADRIRRSATLAMLIDPKLERGGGARVLGRLHDQTPRVPFVTGWASSTEAVKLLRAALAVEPTDRLTKVFLAEAIVSAGGSKDDARKLLNEAAAGSVSGEFVVEESDAVAKAKQALAAL